MATETLIIAGTGRAGTGVGLALSRAGHAVTFVTSGEERPVGEVRALPPGHPEIPRDADWILLAVPDTHLVPTARALAERGIAGAHTLVGHLSGALPSSDLDEAGTFAGTFSAHPLFSFPPRDPPVPMPEGTLVMLESGKDLWGHVSDLFNGTGARIVPLALESKALYHAAAVLCANLPFTLVYEAARLFEECGVPDPDRSAVALVQSAVSNQMAQPGPAALTGPFPRADISTIRRNLSALQYADPDVADIYRTLGDRMADLLGEHGTLSEEPWKSIKKTLR
ncbi:MAG: DUF2520 domain-containing protein [Deltaproteobacteria bacterium]|nr:DUF2520 domain-containing protein [Deltaproteobacteria bacterium]